MYSGKFPCSSIIIKSKKRVSSTKDYSVHIRTQINIDPVHFTFSPENYATLVRSLTVISLCVGRPNHPKIPPPPKKKIRNPRNIFEKNSLFFCVLRSQEDVFARKKISVTKNFHPPPTPTPPPSPQNTRLNPGAIISTPNNSCVRYGLQPPTHLINRHCQQCLYTWSSLSINVHTISVAGAKESSMSQHQSS